MAAIESFPAKIGCVPQTPHEWVRKLEIDTGLRDGITSEGRDRIKALIAHDLLGGHAGGAGLKEN